MLKKIILYLLDILKKILNWFLSLFKKTEDIIKKEDKLIVNKPKLPLLKGTVDVFAGAMGSKYNDLYHETTPFDIALELKDIKKKTDSMSLSELTSKLDEYDKELAILEYKEKNQKPETRKDIIQHEKNLKVIEQNKKTIDELKKDINIKQDINEPKKEKPQKKSDKVTISPLVSKELVKEDEDLIKYRAYVIDTNKLLKDSKSVLKNIDEELNRNIDTDIYYYQLKDLKEKISVIKKEYYDFKHSDYIYILEADYKLNEKDKCSIIKNSNEIDNYLNKCNTLLQRIEDKKQVKSNPEPAIQKTVQVKKEPVLEEQKSIEVPKILLEIEEASLLIKKDIKDQRKSIIKIEEKINNMPLYEQKQKRLGFFDNILSNSFKIGVSLLPIKMFKNRMLGMVVSGFMLNNTIRSMRKLINKDVPVDYIELNRRIKNQVDIINSYDTICNDSLYQISSLKEEFIRCYGNNIDDAEVKKTYTKLLSLEEQVVQERNYLKHKKIKIKDKVKRLDKYKNHKLKNDKVVEIEEGGN